MMWMVIWLLGCGPVPCDEGYGKANDGVCYPLTSTAGDDDDDVTPTGDDDDDELLAIDDSQLDEALRCDEGLLSIEIGTFGDTSMGRIDMADSVWNEGHTIDLLRQETGYTWLAASLQVGGSEWVDGEATVFACDTHFAAPDVMSYIIRVYDLTGELFDCVAFGQDPEAFLQGEGLPNSRQNEEELSQCRVLSGG